MLEYKPILSTLVFIIFSNGHVFRKNVNHYVGEYQTP